MTELIGLRDGQIFNLTFMKKALMVYIDTLHLLQEDQQLIIVFIQAEDILFLIPMFIIELVIQVKAHLIVLYLELLL